VKDLDKQHLEGPRPNSTSAWGPGLKLRLDSTFAALVALPTTLIMIKNSLLLSFSHFIVKVGHTKWVKVTVCCSITNVKRPSNENGNTC
jgi:hypothetical protein